MQKSHTIFIIIGYEQKDQMGNLINSTQFEIIAETYKEALKQAKKYHKSPHYHLKMVIEKEKS